MNALTNILSINPETEILSESSFLYAKRYLIGLLDENAANVEAWQRLIDLYKVCITSYTETAARYTEQAINIAPANSYFHSVYAKFRGIQHYSVSWRFFRFYNERFIEKHSDNQDALINLFHGYVQTNKYDKAEEMLGGITDEKKRTLLKFDMLIQLGKSEEAFAILDKHVAGFCDDPRVLQSAAERHDKADHFDIALKLYEKSFEIMPEPKYLSSLYHRAFMYDRFGHYEKAIEMWEEIKVRSKRDWQCDEDKWGNETIEILKNKIAQREQT